MELDRYLRHVQYVRSQPIWIANLSDGSKFYQDDGRPGVSVPAAWTRLKAQCCNDNVDIVGIDLQMRRRLIRDIVPGGAAAYFFVNSHVRDVQSSFEARAKLFGWLDIDSEQFRINAYRVPDLELLSEPPRSVDEVKPSCVIVNSMAKQQTEKSRFHSKYGAEFVTAAQYLAEVMCEREAQKNKDALPMFFWKTKKWERKFLTQLQHANASLKVFAVEVILRALRSKKGSRIYSFGAQQILLPLFEREQEVYAKEMATMNVATESDNPETVVGDKSPRPSFQGKQSLLSKLRELDGEEKTEGNNRAGDA